MASLSNTPHKIIEKKIGELEVFDLAFGSSNLSVSRFGAQILSWEVAGKPIFFSNPLMVTDKSKALRTGAPICFPWFNKGANWNLGHELSPSHGPSRNSDWKLEFKKPGRESAEISFSFMTKSHLELPLKIKVSYALSATKLNCAFEVLNLSTDSENLFELALHTYLATNSPESAQIFGLKHAQAGFSPPIPIDKIFPNDKEILVASFGDLKLQIHNHNFTNSVIWHPGLPHSLADLPVSKALAPFLCLESLTDKKRLSANQIWRGAVEYSVLPS